MKKIRLGNLIPIITMFIVFVLGDIFNWKDLFVIGLLLIIPVSFFIEGMLCYIKDKGFIIPLVISLSAFLVVIYTMLNDSANIYLKYYGVAYILGYIFGMAISRFKNRQKDSSNK
ncbi:MAG: hypothetical protein ACRCXA_04815 [Peptostreptococcaceae bacterium]